MNTEIVEAVFVSKIWPVGKIILLAMANSSTDGQESVCPSVETITEYTSLSERAVQRNIKQLVADGILICEGSGPSGTNRYKISRKAVRNFVPRGGGGCQR